jgi:hypothetical protein
MAHSNTPRVPTWVRATIAGAAGGAAWRLGINWIFGPAQSLLANPARQSSKMLAAFAPGADAPRMYAQPSVVWIALIAIGVVWGWWFVSLSRSWTPIWWKRGLRFGALAWTLMIPWFEFYLPWNVLREPAPLVALELVCWFGVMMLVGLTIAATNRLLSGVATATDAATI